MISVLGDFARFMVQSIVAPRATVRALLDRNLDKAETLLLASFGYLLMMIAILVANEQPLDERTSVIGFHVQMVIIYTFLIVFASAVTFFAGAIFGGEGSFQDSVTGIAWYCIAVSLIMPVFLLAMPEFHVDDSDPEQPILQTSGGNSTLLLVVSGASLWLQASLIAEVHRFRSVWLVAGLMIAISMVSSTLLAAAVGG